MEEEKDRRMDAADLPEANAATDLGLVDNIAASITGILVMFTTYESFKAPTSSSSEAFVPCPFLLGFALKQPSILPRRPDVRIIGRRPGVYRK